MSNIPRPSFLRLPFSFTAHSPLLRIGTVLAAALVLGSCGSEKSDPFIPSQPAVGGLTVTAVVEDTGVPGIGIRIQGPETKTGTTNSLGTVVFSSIAPGSYTVNITAAPDSIEFGRTSRTVSVPSGGSASVSFLGALTAGS